ncbi:hypothetical protein [Chryseobacterium sp. OSA05B]|uniref:hypothetical protein n=1 Tax=Chryseobacterium sp. OSA05B TaxID=2862650 RepID=UPI001CBC7729|nr:hypothetical protein [Chryseobacterium sp. OSA05B]
MKKALKLCERKELAEGVVNETGITVHRACKIVCMSRSTYYYGHKKDDPTVISKLLDLAARYPKTYYGKIRLEGLPWTEKEYSAFIEILI